MTTRLSALHTASADDKTSTDRNGDALSSQRMQAQRLRALRSTADASSIGQREDCKARETHETSNASVGAIARPARQRTTAKYANIRATPAPMEPPAPPIVLSPLLACDPNTDPEILWYIARNVPSLRRWLVANPSSSAELLEYVAQAGGPGVNHALTILLADP